MKYKNQNRLCLLSNPYPQKYAFLKRILQERTGFSGGFKIPEELRKSKERKKGKKQEKKEEDNMDANLANMITKDEVYMHLNLGHSDSNTGIGKHG